MVLNCELLFALADKMNISNVEKTDILAILETDTNGIFLVKPINDTYSFGGNLTKNTIELSKGEIIIPADLLTAESNITILISDNGSETTIEDCVVSKVEREGTTIDTFKAHISSKKWDKYEWAADSKVTISITYADAYENTATFRFAVETFKEHWYGDKVEFMAR